MSVNLEGHWMSILILNLQLRNIWSNIPVVAGRGQRPRDVGGLPNKGKGKGPKGSQKAKARATTKGNSKGKGDRSKLEQK